MSKSTTVRKPNVTTQALPGFDYDVLVNDGPARPDRIQAHADLGWDVVAVGPAPGNQTQIVFRRKRGVHSDPTR